MSFREKENIINMASGLLITSIFAFIVYQRHNSGQFDLTTDFQTWGKIFLVFMGVSIVARILIYIIFYIINHIATREKEPVSDEMDKLIKLKSTRNAYVSFSLGIVPAFVLLALGHPVYFIFIAFPVSGLLAEIVENMSQLYYYRKGI